MKPVRSYRRNRGITLIEILISLAIGFVVVAAVIVSFIGSGQAGRYHSALTQMNQDAQIALNLLSREVQLAGYAAASSMAATNPPAPAVPNVTMLFHNLACGTGVPNSGTPGTAQPPALDCTLADQSTNVGYISGCDADSAAFASPFVNNQAVPLNAANCQALNANALKNYSGFGVVYEADLTNTVPVTVAGQQFPSDCLGNRIPGTWPGPNFYIARNRYFIAVGATGKPELHCASSGSAMQPLLENVEDMQVWYGLAANPITSAPGTRQIASYAKATAINAAPAGTWDQVLSVRICVLLRSSEKVLTSEDVVGGLDCKGNAVVTNDGYLRRAYYTTATVRSKMSF